MSFFQNKGLTSILNGLTKNWGIEDYFKARKDRNWDRFDKLSDNEKVLYRIREAREYVNGSYSDDDGIELDF